MRYKSVGCDCHRTKNHHNKTTVGRAALYPTPIQTTNKCNRSMDIAMPMFCVLLNFDFMQIGVGQRAVRPTERFYV